MHFGELLRLPESEQQVEVGERKDAGEIAVFYIRLGLGEAYSDLMGTGGKSRSQRSGWLLRPMRASREANNIVEVLRGRKKFHDAFLRSEWGRFHLFDSVLLLL